MHKQQHSLAVDHSCANRGVSYCTKDLQHDMHHHIYYGEGSGSRLVQDFACRQHSHQTTTKVSTRSLSTRREDSWHKEQHTDMTFCAEVFSDSDRTGGAPKA